VQHEELKAVYGAPASVTRLFELMGACVVGCLLSGTVGVAAAVHAWVNTARRAWMLAAGVHCACSLMMLTALGAAGSAVHDVAHGRPSTAVILSVFALLAFVAATVLAALAARRHTGSDPASAMRLPVLSHRLAATLHLFLALLANIWSKKKNREKEK
jgi:hypothetical protein